MVLMFARRGGIQTGISPAPIEIGGSDGGLGELEPEDMHPSGPISPSNPVIGLSVGEYEDLPP